MTTSSKQLRELGIVLRVKNKINELLPGIIYFKVILFYFLILSLISFLILKDQQSFLLFEIILASLTIFLFYFLSRIRKSELEEIKNTIYRIRNNYYENFTQISLNRNLLHVEEEIRLMFEKIQTDIGHLEKLEKIRSEFLGNVSHELRTPIFTIQGFLETLLDGAVDNPKVNRVFLEKAKTHTISLSNLLNDLIDISMIESGEMRMSFRYFFVNEYLRSIVDEFTPLAEEKNLKIKFTESEKKFQVFGDKNKLRQVLNNLIQNAIKYTDKGSVEVALEEETKIVKIIVRDTGIGISENDLDRVFERFYRVDKARSRAAGGTGLGLAIVKHIIEAHKSKIEVRSQIYNGSEFSFKLIKG